MTHHRTSIPLALALAATLAAGCSNDKPTAGSSPGASPSASPSGAASARPSAAAPAGSPAAPAAQNANAWDGVASGSGSNGGTWVIHIYNCTSDPLGPWKGKFTFTNSTGGVDMRFASEEFSFRFADGATPVPVKLKTKGKAIAGAPVKVDFDISTDVEMRTDPGKTVVLKEKSQGGTVVGSTPGGSMGASLFGSAGDTVTIPIKGVAQCNTGDVQAPSQPAQPAKP